MSVKEVELLKIINDYRHEKELSKLVPEVLATKVAYLNNVRMEATNSLNHAYFDNRKAESKSNRYSENLAKGYNTAPAMFQAYLQSPTHKAVIDRNDMTHLSISIVGKYNTCIFTNY
jgi:uncharacterized protein YkwD